jgi:DNA-directed RNA polymerase specialized sigma subunit, sigma24 homolog
MEAVPFNHAAALSACARGDEAAFHRLFEYEAPRMLALGRRLVREDAEALVHDTFALIWKNADQYDPGMGSARAWLYSVLRHLARHRRLKRNEIPPATAPSLPPYPLVGRLSRLAKVGDKSAYRALAHGYLDGVDYLRVATWLRCSAAELRKNTRQTLKDTAE